MTERRTRRSSQRAPGGVVAELGPGAAPILRPPSPSPIPLTPDSADDERDEQVRFFVLGGENGTRAASAAVRVYHLVYDPASRQERPCWAFTITQRAADQLAADGLLVADGATYPDGQAVVPAGVDPGTVEVRCGSCRSNYLPDVALRFIAR